MHCDGSHIWTAAIVSRRRGPNTAPFNATGHPALNVPCGFGRAPNRPEVKLPIGMQLIGRRWEDATVARSSSGL